ncbi:uncharacterized protein B0I36DRAFT_357160 [Microdochium trichocladiopsis]|uniref:Uncharacterized protein n=1 Tax=Microdochium trichocladiopsis TaxID=1682393 RepID=A0A9P8YI94_9PEZI|nr:uncharacterized protein B0I36DRAFT_357160 [Microdochium trichocladiopsis]KAH7039766.1 hypothetical protein B0I36DRAFT_357160 [Microdochium trichocladiopsis]
MATEASPLLSGGSGNNKRTSTANQKVFTRPLPNAVTYDLSTPDQATIRLPPGSTWTSGPHWHDTHTEFLQVIKGRAEVILGFRGPGARGSKGKGNGGRDGSAGAGGEVEEEEEDEDGEGVTVMPAVTPLDGVVIIPRGTVHEWRRSRALLSRSPQGDGEVQHEEEEELVVKEWTDPKDGQKETFFRNLNGIILDALAAEAELSRPRRGGAGQAAEQDAEGGEEDDSEGPKSWRMRTLDLELNNLFWRMDNWPLVLDRDGGWPGWMHGLATRAVLLGSVVLGKILGFKGVYGEYEAQR